jgi:hypothetical protein
MITQQAPDQCSDRRLQAVDDCVARRDLVLIVFKSTSGSGGQEHAIAME